MRCPCLAVFPGCFQVRGEALEIDDQRLLEFRIEPTTIDPVSKLFLFGADAGNSRTGSAVSIIAHSRSLSFSAAFGCARIRAAGGTGG